MGIKTGRPLRGALKNKFKNWPGCRSVGVVGPFRFIREGLKSILPKNKGCILNVSSVNGERPFCGASDPSSKGEINPLTKNVAAAQTV